MKRNTCLLGKDANTVPCGKYLKREGLFCEPRNILLNYMFALCQGKTSSCMLLHIESSRDRLLSISHVNLFLLHLNT